LAQLGTTPFNRLPGVRASALKSRQERELRVAVIEARAVADQIHGAVIEDSAYPFFVRDLLKTAQSSVRLIMFFMRFEDVAAYPTDDVIAEIVAAGGRGLDVKVILDRDAEGSEIGATVVNQEAFDYLQGAGIPVRWDTVERVTHTKLLVVDDRHVVIGSHNWTAGSFFAYDDTSIYVRSVDLAQHYLQQFDQLWEMYAI
jgi:cardiolipin synthase